MSGKAGRIRLALRAERAFGLTALPIALPKRKPKQALPPAPALKALPQRILPPEPTTKPLRMNTQALVPPTSLIPDEPFTTQTPPREQKILLLDALNSAEVKGCIKCRLCETRTHTVFGEGDPDAQIFFIGEGPGESEDLQARPFVGRSGEQLNKWIAAMGLTREQVYIANIVKCRPPKNREPAPDETATCTPYLQRQLEIIRPKAIITLGRPAAQHMLATKNSMGSLRGQWQNWRGIPLMPTYHPAYVLRNNTLPTRAAVWDDLKHVMKMLKLPIPARQRDQQS